MCSYSWGVPSKVKGPIEIATAADLGGLGEKEGPRIVYDWKPVRFHPSLAPWVLFIILLIIAFYQDRRSLSIVFPVLILQCISILFGMLIGVASYTSILSTLCLAIATILMQPIAFGSKKPFTDLLQVSAIVLLYGLLMLFSYEPAGIDTKSLLFIKYGKMSLIIILSVIVSARICKKFNHDIKLLPLWLLLCSMVLTGLVLMVSFLFQMLDQGFSIIMIVGMIGLAFMAIFLGIGIFLFILPFILLCIKNSFYRSRLMDMLDLPEKKRAVPLAWMTQEEKEKQPDESQV